MNAQTKPLVVERICKAPVSAVWKAITDNGELKKWFFDLKDFKAEKGFEFTFVGQKGDVRYTHLCKVMEVIPQKKLSYSWRYDHHQGDSLVTIELFPEGNDTKVRLTHEGLESFGPHPDYARENFNAGWNFIIGEGLKNSAEGNVFVISRTFNAPRELVWKAFTEPERMQLWWGPKGSKVIASKMDFRVGGIYHYGMEMPDGKKIWGKFVYRHIVSPERIVLINSFSDEKSGITHHPMNPTWPLELTSVFTFKEENGKTTLTIQWTPVNATDEELKTFRDGMASMNQGWGGTLDQLSGYLAKNPGKQ